ncbi:phosphatase PAP2 family protein [Candidatus Sulfidibacterium hydrothermale]|uniref:phosphatase PAP2 family protein n=1 Tax=Candidatus Sulfidibacterium hydrothermale TaxID=2875962 RepID=UPI001F0B05A0|nr:phosphatase PAP2 family protein [Candidatus Sulfidibacterium hydrothermale]UBM63425.1 phosphatase PAP2 family protein [Candidatus Sulfidibacterium hydrothermale]
MKESTQFIRFTKKNLLINSTLALVYLLWNFLIGGPQTGHFLLVVLWFTLYYLHPATRKFALGFSIFIVYWIVYDSMRGLPNYKVSPVHIRQPYELEKALFGITYQGKLLTPNEFFNLIHTKFLDILTGLFYLNWVPVPIAFAVYLYFKDKNLFTRFSLVFLLVNLMGFVIYYLYPEAPPWYVEIYGFHFQPGVHGHMAGLARFDQITGWNVFKALYEKNANVLAAMPSLHASYPVIVLYYAIKKKLGWFNIFFVIFLLGIWFSAVYTGHHYVIDVIAGASLAVTGIFIFEKIANKMPFKKWLSDFASMI